MTVIVFSILFCTLLVGIPSLIFSFGDWIEIVFRVSIAAFIGLMMGIEISKEKFKHPVVLQSISGIAAGGLLGYWLEPSVTFVALGLIGGLVVGATAQWWINHVPLP